MPGWIPRIAKTQKFRLDSNEVVATAKNLVGDIVGRFPGSQLSRLAGELAELAVATEERALWASRPILVARMLSALAIALVFLGLWYLASHLHAKWELNTFNDVMNTVNTGFNLLVLLAGALWFCVTLEARLKRKEALGFIEELREFAQVIDAAQLHYTPDFYRPADVAEASHPAFDETYLLLSTQMLGVIGNLSHLYTRGATGDSILRAASEAQMLVLAIAAKHLAKAEAVQRMKEDLARTSRTQVA